MDELIKKQKLYSKYRSYASTIITLISCSISLLEIILSLSKSDSFSPSLGLVIIIFASVLLILSLAFILFISIKLNKNAKLINKEQDSYNNLFPDNTKPDEWTKKYNDKLNITKKYSKLITLTISILLLALIIPFIILFVPISDKESPKAIAFLIIIILSSSGLLVSIIFFICSFFLKIQLIKREGYLILIYHGIGGSYVYLDDKKIQTLETLKYSYLVLPNGSQISYIAGAFFKESQIQPDNN